MFFDVAEPMLYFLCLKTLKKPQVLLKDSSTPMPVNNPLAKKEFCHLWESKPRSPLFLTQPSLTSKHCTVLVAPLHSPYSNTIHSSVFVTCPLQLYRNLFSCFHELQMLPKTRKKPTQPMTSTVIKPNKEKNKNITVIMQIIFLPKRYSAAF